MKALRAVVNEVFCLVVDDGSLAVATVAVLAVIALLIRAGLDARTAALVLAVALPAVFVENVRRSAAAKARRRPD